MRGDGKCYFHFSDCRGLVVVGNGMIIWGFWLSVMKMTTIIHKKKKMPAMTCHPIVCWNIYLTMAPVIIKNPWIRRYKSPKRRSFGQISQNCSREMPSIVCGLIKMTAPHGHPVGVCFFYLTMFSHWFDNAWGRRYGYAKIGFQVVLHQSSVKCPPRENEDESGSEICIGLLRKV